MTPFVALPRGGGGGVVDGVPGDSKALWRFQDMMNECLHRLMLIFNVIGFGNLTILWLGSRLLTERCFSTPS